MSAEPLLVVLIGPGGVGKGTLARRLVEADPNLWLSRSWTTRERRPSESGDEYFYVDRATFEKAIESRQFLEWAEFHGQLYGTPLPEAPEGSDVLLEIEVQGAEQILKLNPTPCVLSFFRPRWNCSKSAYAPVGTTTRTWLHASQAPPRSSKRGVNWPPTSS